MVSQRNLLVVQPKDVVVVIPLYLHTLSQIEQHSLEQCLRVLAAYSIVLVKPRSLDVSALCRTYPQLHAEDFADEYFVSLRSYNRLVLSTEFYRRFSRYAYLLIYQLDAYVFADELLEWCRKGYDYIGAPWLPSKPKYQNRWGECYLRSCFRFWLKVDPMKLKKNGAEYYHNTVGNRKYYKYQVGNGGFSLRKVDTFIRLTTACSTQIAACLADHQPFYPEDLLLLIELEQWHVGCRLKKPDYKEALQFAFEENPEWAYQLNGNRLPFGCHAWCRAPYFSFWKSIVLTN